MMYVKLHTCSTVPHRPDLDQQVAVVYAMLILLQDACSDISNHIGGCTEVAKLSGLVCNKWPVVQQERGRLCLTP